MWAAHRHEVSVLTCVPNHAAEKVYEGYRNRLLQGDAVAGIRVFRMWTFLSWRNGCVTRPSEVLLSRSRPGSMGRGVSASWTLPGGPRCR